VDVRADVEQIQSTRTEKWLAVALAAFLVLGLVWTYQRLDDVIRHAEPVRAAAPSFADPAVRRLDRAQSRLFAAQDRNRAALQQLVLAREAYRTALEAHRPARVLGVRYDAAQARLAAARAAVAAAERQVRAAQPAAAEAERRAEHSFASTAHRQARDSFLARLGLVAVTIVVAYLLLALLRRRPSRWYPLAGSAVAAAVVLSLVLASDYATDYFDPFRWGIALIAVFGIVATLLAYWALQRYVTRRLPQRRIRRGECPFCGYPVRGNAHCEGCGRDVVAPCPRCQAPRRVGTPRCGVCGAG
jgi:hypothetical protein